MVILWIQVKVLLYTIVTGLDRAIYIISYVNEWKSRFICFCYERRLSIILKPLLNCSVFLKFRTRHIKLFCNSLRSKNNFTTGFKY